MHYAMQYLANAEENVVMAVSQDRERERVIS